jgi:hypothetical protein
LSSLGDSSYTLKAQGKGVDLSALQNPVTVALAIGDDAGSTTAFRENENTKRETGTQKTSRERETNWALCTCFLPTTREPLKASRIVSLKGGKPLRDAI